MWEKVKDKEREHSSSPAWVNSPNPTGESFSTSWKPRDLRGWVCLVPVPVQGLRVCPQFGSKATLGTECWDWCESVTKERGPAMARTCCCHLPVLHWRWSSHIHESCQCWCNALGCESRLSVIVSECTRLVNAIDAAARMRSKCCVSCLAFIFKYIWVGFPLF